MSTDISVASILSNSVAQCASTDSLAHAARLMKDSQGTSVIVMEKGKPVGIWTERDSLNLDFSKPKTFEMPIGELMRSPVKTINSRISVSEAGIRFKKEGTHHFLVVDDSEKVIGIITQTEVIQNHGVEHFFTMPDTRAALSGPLVKIPGKATINQVVKALRDSNSDAVIVEGNKDEEYGIITERDLIRLVAEQKKYHSVNEVANRPVITIPHDSSILIARDMLKEKKIRHLGVTDDDGNLIGLLTYSDILKCIQYEYVHRMDEYLKAQGLAEGGKEKTVNLAQKVLDVSADGIMIVNKEGIIEAVNPAFTTITGYARDEAVGMNPRFLKSGRHDDSFFKSMWESLLNKGFWQGEIWNRRKNGEVYLEWLTINVIYDEKGEIQRYSGIFSDISERKKTEEHIRKLAYFDILTGLPNRRLFMDRVSMAIANAGRSGQHLGIMFVDLDLFKRINDTFGHIVGDGVLKEMSVRLSKSLREGDTICRLGGDEFTVLLPKVDEVDDIVKAARRAINDIKNPFIVDGHELYVTASIGIAIFPEDGLAVEELIKNADEAMYRAKELGRNNFQLYSQVMNAQSVERINSEDKLRDAVEKEEFRLNYQVKVDASTGRMSGVEALIRWHSADMGVVQPRQFIPLAEDSGLITPIGEWVIQTACKQNKEWQKKGLPTIPVSVNISNHQIRNGNLSDFISETLKETGLDPEYLELEFTEASVMNGGGSASETISELSKIGVKISIDDFGTGFTNLNKLKRIKVDSLKIDQSFVHDMIADSDDMAIVATIIAMGKSMGMTVVAEGVETDDQVKFLKGEGCDEIQGYLISRPLSPENLISLFDRDLLPEAAS